MSTKEVTKLVIDRAKWLRGEGGTESCLLRRSDGKMCCLGFYGTALGVDQKHLLNQATPNFYTSTAWPEWILDPSAEDSLSYACDKAMCTNDSAALTDEAREQELTALFAANGVELEFVG